jgi:uncharacterized damage-inducible protein DinB
MSLSQMLIPEIEHEAKKTRAYFERLPDDKLDWTPHPKSMPLGKLATHIVEMYGWGTGTMLYPEYNMNPPDGPAYQPPGPMKREALLEMFDTSVKDFVAAVAAASDESWGETWSLKSGEHVLFAMPRAAVIRDMILNHIVHHRAQLGVYYRLNDIAVPQTYGPTADEGMM